ncbi:MAG: C45 family autoproteolytic acyltransferase/hydrolase [Fimbriimonas sp.]|nr:C45 family autoproteolytic acyltransferase/hydrolase [Fimbriimonas sp.]
MSCLICALVVLGFPGQAEIRTKGAFRSDDAGWIYLHLQGSPRDVGFQYGSLAAKEIDDAHRALLLSFKQPPYDWAWCRKAARDVFWPKLDKEYQEEIAGQAEGLKAKGYAYDEWDVLAYNAYIEIQGYYIPYLQSRKPGGVREGTTRTSCSAFIATGKTTKDGKIVMGHNLWWDYLMGQRANVLLDITPEKGNRVLMDAFCGFIHSGSDFAVNSTGILLCETTISGFSGFDPNGIPEFMRMRKAIQYSNSLDDVDRIFVKGNNGGYANTWLIGDTKTNEIGKLELGLKVVDFQRKNSGYFVGSNFPESSKLIAEEIPGGWDANPMTNGCERRRVRWNTLLTRNKGQVDAQMAKKFLADTYDEVLDRDGASDSTLCGVSGLSGAVNTKVVDSTMANSMRIWARMGISNGSTFEAKTFLAGNPAYAAIRPFLRDIPSRPWTVFPAAK